jgi:pilus assembly protein Flp/PilA
MAWKLATEHGCERRRQGLLIHFLEPVMKVFLSAVKKFAEDEDGITAIEYGLIAAVMATAIGVAFTTLSTGLQGLFKSIAGMLSLSSTPSAST